MHSPLSLHTVTQVHHCRGQAALKGTESWTPLCLPRFNPNGYLYSYIGYLDEHSTVCLLLIAAQQKPEIFHQFQQWKHAVASVTHTHPLVIPVTHIKTHSERSLSQLPCNALSSASSESLCLLLASDCGCKVAQALLREGTMKSIIENSQRFSVAW